MPVTGILTALNGELLSQKCAKCEYSLNSTGYSMRRGREGEGEVNLVYTEWVNMLAKACQ
jgi:hypothetical protein